MAVDLRFHPEAEDEFIAAMLWYEERVPGLGVALETEVGATLSSIRESTERWPTQQHGCRSAPVRRFPYRIVYVRHDDHIWIVAVAHQRRRPRYWSSRVP